MRNPLLPVSDYFFDTASQRHLGFMATNNQKLRP
jgi:hypothetical protein